MKVDNQLVQKVKHYLKKEIKLKGNVERAAAEMPGLVAHRFNQLQEIEAILNYMNIELRRLRSSYFKKYLENYQRALSSRDVEKYVDGESDVVDYEKIINESKKYLDYHFKEGKHSLNDIEDSKIKEILNDITNYLINRSN